MQQRRLSPLRLQPNRARRWRDQARAFVVSFARHAAGAVRIVLAGSHPEWRLLSRRERWLLAWYQLSSSWSDSSKALGLATLYGMKKERRRAMRATFRRDRRDRWEERLRSAGRKVQDWIRIKRGF